jgi:hypothetical protein
MSDLTPEGARGGTPSRDYSRLDATAFSRTRLAGLTALVAGAGALGNEVIKNLALLGIGRLVIVDRDRVERSNLTRSVLFCLDEIETHLRERTPKAVLAASRAHTLNPDVRTEAHVVEVADLGVGVVRRADIIFSCLDNEMARMEIGWSALRADRPLLDGGLGNINPSSGMVLLFPGGRGPCVLCRKAPERRRALLWALQGHEDPCWLKERELEQDAMVSTTPLMASAIGALQVEVGLRHVFDRASSAAAPADTVLPGSAFRLTLHPVTELEVRTVERSPSCPFHAEEDGPIAVIERPDRRSDRWIVRDLLAESAPPGGALQLDWPLTGRAVCRACRHEWAPLVRRARFRREQCPACQSDEIVETEVVATIDAASVWAARTVADLGLPPGHVHEVVAVEGDDVRRVFVEVSGDLAHDMVSPARGAPEADSPRDLGKAGRGRSEVVC